MVAEFVGDFVIGRQNKSTKMTKRSDDAQSGYCPVRTRPKPTVVVTKWSTRFVLAKSLPIQLRQASTNLSYVLDKGPDEVTKRQLLVSEIKPQDELSPPGDLT